MEQKYLRAVRRTLLVPIVCSVVMSMTTVVSGASATSPAASPRALLQSRTHLPPHLVTPMKRPVPDTRVTHRGKPELPPQAPVMQRQPRSLTVHPGDTVNFTASAKANPAARMQWYERRPGAPTFAKILGATETSLRIIHVTLGRSGERFRVVFTNARGHVTSRAAVLTVDSSATTSPTTTTTTLPTTTTTLPTTTNDFAPVITLNPQNASALPSGDVRFVVAASGNPTPTVQWEISTNAGQSFEPISQATNVTLALTGVTVQMNGNEYEAHFTNVAGSVTSTPATLSVSALAITVPPGSGPTPPPPPTTYAPGNVFNPRSIFVVVGSLALFGSSATGVPTPTVQWEVSTDSGTTFSPIMGATSTALALTGVTLSMNGNEYRAVFTNSLGSATSIPATLNVGATASIPQITLNPVSTTVSSIGVATFHAAATGVPTPIVQWEVSTDSGATFSPVPGGELATLGFAVTTAMNNNEYEAVFTNSAGSATSTPATLTITAAPTIDLEPQNDVVVTGANASFYSTASGLPTPTEQWEVSTNAGATFSPISGATSATLDLNSVTLSMNNFEYEAVFTNSSGTVTSMPATLGVTTYPTNYQTSTNWGGYAVTGGTFSTVTGSWTVPTASCTSATTYSSQWIGIDGYTSATVEQDGTEVDCSQGVASYSAWYEMYGNTNPQCNCYYSTPVPTSDAVHPGDGMNASVSFSGGTWNMTISDATQNWSFTQLATGPTPKPNQSSAEWVLERPTICADQSCSTSTLATLTPQSPVTFTNAAAGNQLGQGSISRFTYWPIELIDSSNNPVATPSGLSPDGSSFTVNP